MSHQFTWWKDKTILGSPCWGVLGQNHENGRTKKCGHVCLHLYISQHCKNHLVACGSVDPKTNFRIFCRERDGERRRKNESRSGEAVLKNHWARNEISTAPNKGWGEMFFPLFVGTHLVLFNPNFDFATKGFHKRTRAKMLSVATQYSQSFVHAISHIVVHFRWKGECCLFHPKIQVTHW